MGTEQLLGIQNSTVDRSSSAAVQNIGSSKVVSAGQSGVGDSTLFTSLGKTQPGVVSSAIDAIQLYSQSCAMCHGLERQGKSGPALTAVTMAGQTISQVVNKLAAHQNLLSAAEVEALANLLMPTIPTPSPVTLIAPTAPSNLLATASGSQINVAWTDNSNNESGLRIQRATDSGFTVGLTNMTAVANANSYADVTVAAGTTYYYRMLATNTAGASAWSNTASVATPAAVNAAQVYTQSCSSCHGANWQGGSGPALTTTALASRTIAYLVSFTPSHRSGLTAAVVNALADFLKNTPP